MDLRKIIAISLTLFTLLIFQNSKQVFGFQEEVYKISPAGNQPSIVINKNQKVEVAYGLEDKIFYSFSSDKGKTFSSPVIVGQLKDLQLAMTRGVNIASGNNSTLIATTDTHGDVFSWTKDNKSKTWAGPVKINDVPEVAKEGFVSITGNGNTFYAVWNDLRHKKGNELFGSYSKDRGKTWSRNSLIYKSPDGAICDCCKPSITTGANGHLYILFRNWINGNRDIYLTGSSNGKTFDNPQKMGTGNWKLQGCPMDGGSISVNGYKVKTLWQREGTLFLSEPGKKEIDLGKGRLGSIAYSKSGTFLTWLKGKNIMVKTDLQKEAYPLDVGNYPKVAAFNNSHSAIVVWESTDGIKAKILN